VGYDALCAPDEQQTHDICNPFTIHDYAEAVAGPLLHVFEKAGLSVPNLYVEPGRYIAGNSTVLLATVGYVKPDRGRTWVSVDASINDLMMRETRNYAYCVIPAEQMDDPYAKAPVVTGPLCYGGRPLSDRAELPSLTTGQLIAFLDAGAYAETHACRINGVPRPATILVNSEQGQIIRRRERITDVFETQVLPDRFVPSYRSVSHLPAMLDVLKEE
jgi:diaminopimelate decarboxylase